MHIKPYDGRRHVLVLLTGLLLVSGGGCSDSGLSQSAVPPESGKSAGQSTDAKLEGSAHQFVVAVLDDPRLGATLAREWNADSALTITADVISSTELTSGDAATLDRLARADVVLFPGHLLGTLVAEQRIGPAPESVLGEPELLGGINPADLFPLLKRNAVRWGSQQYGVCLGGAPWMILYRVDLLERAGLAPPETWQDLDRILEQLARLQDAWRADGTVGSEFQVWLDPNDENVSSQLLLARAASYTRHAGQYSSYFDYRTGKALIDQPPFARALDEQQRAWAHTSRGYRQYSEHQVASMFLAGDVAVAMWRPLQIENGGGDTEIKSVILPNQIGLVPLPGSYDSYSFANQQWELHEEKIARRVTLLGPDDCLAGVSSRSRQKRIAWHFLAELAGGPRTSSLLAESRHCAPFRSVHLAQSQHWFRGWQASVAPLIGDVLRASYSAADVMIAPRVAGSDRYLKSLDQQVREVLSGQTAPQAGLESVARDWDAAVGDATPIETRRSQYLLSLGLEP